MKKDCPRLGTAPGPNDCKVTMANTNQSQPQFDVYPGKINDQPVQEMLVDPCCTLSQVHPKWLPENYVQEGRTWIRGTVSAKQYPTTTVKLAVKGKAFCIRVAVRSDLDYDAILGLDIKNIRALVSTDAVWEANEDDGSINEDQSSVGASEGGSEDTSDPETSGTRRTYKRRAR